MKRHKKDKSTDLMGCRRRIMFLLDGYNCSIQTDDYHYVWLQDNDTNETVGFEK